MNIGIIISIIIALLIISVIITGIIQKREQIAAQKRQQAAQFYYRAQNALDMIELMRAIPISSEIIQFLLSLVVQSLKTTRSIWPKQLNISQEISRAEMHLEGYKAKTSQRIPLPADEQSLSITTARLKKFMQYLKALHHAAVLPENYFEKWHKKLYQDLARIDIEGLLKLATRAAENSKPGTAKNYLTLAKSRFDVYVLDPTYKNEQLQLLNSILQQLKDTANSNQEEDPKSSGYQPGNRHEGVQLGDAEDIFTEKKKW